MENLDLALGQIKNNQASGNDNMYPEMLMECSQEIKEAIR